MGKIIVLSCVKDDCYSKNALHLLEKHVPEIKKGVEAFAKISEGTEYAVLLPEGMADPGFGWPVYNGINTPTADNPYSCVQQFEGKLPRPMIQDDYVPAFDGKEVAAILPENAFWLGTQNFTVKHITINGEVKEVAVGTKLSEVVDTADAKAVLVGGLKGKYVLPEELANMEVALDELYDSVTVIPKSACMVDTLAKHFANAWAFSCGKCVTCREGSLQFKMILEEAISGKGKAGDVDLINDVGPLVKIASYCPYGQNMPEPLLSAVALFKDEFDAHVKKKSCPAGVCFGGGDVYVILPDVCTGCEDCVDECPDFAIEGKKGFIHMIDQDMCEHCGKCVEACDEEAIIKVEGKMPKLPKKLTRVGKF